ncbi:MAG: hypothetical protein R3E52_12075 [Burkholderiaceae bacterium]
METLRQELAAAAARLVVEEGLDYGGAKRRAQKLLGVPARTVLPDNDAIEVEVRTYIELFHGETQPGELQALRHLALDWMERLAAFRPHIQGAVWNGTATRRSDIHLQLYCDDPKSAEIALIDRGVRYDVRPAPGGPGPAAELLSFSAPCPALGECIGIHLLIQDYDALRGALKLGADGRPRQGDAAALAARLNDEACA